ncbi:MAG TPA: CHASE3 domain-containing protein [Chthoniobacterales bacterium]|nr:CHASE3 domain-containing protein [Chthoniobacterales bacterium]
MSLVPTTVDHPGETVKKTGFGRAKIEWLLSPDHFHFKLFLGTIAGVLVILLLAVICVVLTLRGQQRDRLRSHTIEVMRLSSVVDNDVAALENSYRGQLLTRDGTFLGNFGRLQELFFKDSRELANVLAEDSGQRKRILKMRGNVQIWLKNNVLSFLHGKPIRSEDARAALQTPVLNETREAIDAIQREEEVALNHRVRDQEWATQSTQVLTFLPKLQRTASDMQKEKRAYLLTGDPAFIDSYKRAVADFYAYHGYLSVLVGHDPAQVALLNEIRQTVEAWVTQCAVPCIEARREGRIFADPAQVALGESLMGKVRRAMEHFEQEQMDLYRVHSAAAARERILTATGIDVFCALAALLMIASSTYSFVICRRQLRKLDSADFRIRSVVDHVLDGMITIDERGDITSMNPAAKRMFGYAGGRFAGESFTRLVPKYFEREGDGSPVACQWARLARRIGGTTFAVGRTRGRVTFPVEISLTKTTADKETFYIAMVRDIKERRRFEEELAAEKESLAVTLASIGDGVITTDLKGHVVVCNAAGEAMTGWKASEAVGKPLRAVFEIAADSAISGGSKPSPATGYRSEAEAILLGTPERATLTSRDGVERIIEQVASPIRNGKNEISGVVLVFRDITKRQRDEAERRKAEALDQLGLLAGGIAHDFNNLLTAIIGNISLASLLLPADDDLVLRLEDAKNASFRARDLAQQLLTFARGGAPIKQAASIADLIGETVSFSLRGSHSRSDLAIEPELWSAEFDPGQISQVIANLIVNADQAMPAGGTIHVSCDNFSYQADTSPAIDDLRPGDYIRIRVRDEGTGIPPEYLKQIFDPYFTTKPKGSGLGLATTYSVVKNHDGLITVESVQHCGSTFTVYLPAARQRDEVPIEPPAPEDEAIKTGSGRILVVDDEETIRLLIDFTLSRLGYEVVAAETSLRGIELYREALEEGHRFDLVILDLTLPGGMGGKEALKKLIDIDPMVNAVVSSGYAMDATMSRYEDFGFRGVIAKPYQAEELARKVHAVIEASRVNYNANCDLQHAC